MKYIHRILSNLIGRFELTMVQYYLYAYDFILSFKNYLTFYCGSSSCCVWFQTVASCICVVLNLPKCVKEYIFLGGVSSLTLRN